MKSHAACVILKVNLPDHSKIASSGPVSSLDFSAVFMCRGVPVGVVYVGNNAVFTSEVVLRQNQAGMWTAGTGRNFGDNDSHPVLHPKVSKLLNPVS